MQLNNEFFNETGMVLRGFNDWSGELTQRLSNNPTLNCSFGVRFLDDALNGILKNDLVLIGARSGIGKSEIITKIAYQNAFIHKKRVLLFALEATDWEIHQRILYRQVAKQYYKLGYGIIEPLFYRDWITGIYPEKARKIEEVIKQQLTLDLMLLDVVYTNGKDFTISHFGHILNTVRDDVDLIIVDHLHYFDFDGDNENKEIKEIIKRIRDLALCFNKPVVLVSHLRKRDRGLKNLVPDIDEFHGTSEIVKRATKVITFAPYYDEEKEKEDKEKKDNSVYSTIFRVAKNRLDGSATKFVGMVNYDIKMNDYSDEYDIGRLEKSDTVLRKLTDPKDCPNWATRFM